jgi:uncharacterized protein
LVVLERSTLANCCAWSGSAMPNRILMLADGGQDQQELSKFLSVVSSTRMKDGKATAYVCENYLCNLPTPDPNVVARLLDMR